MMDKLILRIFKIGMTIVIGYGVYSVITLCWRGLEMLIDKGVHTSNADTIIALFITYLILNPIMKNLYIERNGEKL